jgi:hypothetical protein
VRLEQTDTVDFLGVEKGTGVVMVTLVDDCDWSNESRHLQLLQSKLNRYLDFIESGEVYQELLRTTGYEVAVGSPVTISILAKFPFQGEGQRFLDHVERVAREAGVRFSFKVIGPNKQSE